MIYETGTVLMEKQVTDEFLIMLGYSKMIGGEPSTCSCLVVTPNADNTRARVRGIKFVSEDDLVMVDRPVWADYINVSW
jgi:hypothetical protein